MNIVKIIDKTGKMIIQPVYDDALPFKEGLATVRLNGKYGFIDKSGKMIIQSVYDGENTDLDGF